MRAVEITEFGGPENLRLVDRPDPTAAPGHAVLAVAAAGVGFFDVLLRQGAKPDVGTGTVPGLEVAGTVIEVGSEGDAGWVGRRVFATTGHGGGYSERAMVPVESLVELPEDVSCHDAVALGVNSLVAAASVERADVKAGERVLVRGAGGGIGVLTTQLAAARGATVIASVPDRSVAQRLYDLGATEVVGADAVDPGPDARYHAVIDIVAGSDTATFIPLLRPNGRYVISGVVAGAPTPDFGMTLFANFQQSWTISALSLSSAPSTTAAETFALVFADMREGRLKPVLHSTFPLDEAAAAHTLLESRASFGKIVLTV
ncbi:zinc-binding alcohol dehydrogenase family protein [Streptomyces sp. NPDC057539]|uniref:quinone oxidoreductase family protein n=1 Tax=Streptomyces sp. NPDC057539 TaxID=3346159 RepID=UPI0036C6059B